MKIKDILSMINLDTFDIGKYEELKKSKNNLSNSDKKILNKILTSSKNKCKEEVLSVIICYAIWYPDEAIQNARRKGIFRYKVFGIKGKNNAKYYLTYLRDKADILGFSELSISYIIQKTNCDWFEEIYCKIEKKIDVLMRDHYKKRIRKRIQNVNLESSLHKELLAYIDMLFFMGSGKSNHTDFNKLNSYSQEEIAEGVSYLLFKYTDIYEISQEKNYFVDAGYILSDDIERLILLACQINYLLETELLIDFFDYDVLMNGNEITIKSRDDSLEKSIRMAFIKQEMQEILFYGRAAETDESAYLSKISSLVLEEMGDTVVKKINSGILSRYVFEIPTAIIDFVSEQKVLGKIEIFKEEALEIEHFIKEMYMTPDELYDKKITEHCTAYDIILCQRFFRFVFYMQKSIYDNEKNMRIILQSLIPLTNRDMLIQFFTMFLKDIQKAEEIYNLLKYDSNYKYDVQYTPFVEIGQKVIYPLSIVSRSNLLRNTIAYSHLSKNEIVNDDGGLEPLVRFCASSFERCNYDYKVFTNKKYTYKGQKGEIDVLVISDEEIIVIECKEPLMPTSNFEMRATFEHIEKASKQLDLSKEAFADDGFRKKYFADNLKENGKKRTIRTCTVLGNRLFSIWSGSKHPIRYANELDMILTNGIIRGTFTEWSIWKKDHYTHSDLVNYLNQEGTFNTIMKASMEKYDNSIDLYGKKIYYESYLWNLEKAYLLCDEKLRTVKKDEEQWNKFLEICELQRNADSG